MMAIASHFERALVGALITDVAIPSAGLRWRSGQWEQRLSRRRVEPNGRASCNGCEATAGLFKAAPPCWCAPLTFRDIAKVLGRGAAKKRHCSGGLRPSHSSSRRRRTGQLVRRSEIAATDAYDARAGAHESGKELRPTSCKCSFSRAEPRISIRPKLLVALFPSALNQVRHGQNYFPIPTSGQGTCDIRSAHHRARSRTCLPRAPR